MDGIETAFQLLPTRYLEQRSRICCEGAEEFRLRRGQAMTMVKGQREYPLPGEPITENELYRLLEKATGASMHTAASSLANGFVSYKGLRIGVCGTAAVRDGEICGFRIITSISIRIGRECCGICDELMRELERTGFGNILILSPPGGGKTTALREMIRLLSNKGIRVGLVDERWEIAGDASGGGFDLGTHCDVISGVPKARGAMILLRGMNPQLIAMDEITQTEDVEAVFEIVGCGVKLIATAHAAGPEDLTRRPLYRRLFDERIFTEVIQIRQYEEHRSYQLRRSGV